MDTTTLKNHTPQSGYHRLFVATLFACCALLAVTAPLALGATDKVTSSTALVLRTPSQQIPDTALLDVGIPTLNDGLYLADEDDTVFPEVRFAEAIYFSNQLAKVMEKSGAWGAIRVTPSANVIMDLYITGTILQSDGETMDLEIQVKDSSGKQWFAKKYKQTTGKYAYDRRLKRLGDPFENLFIRIANDLLAYREKLSDQQAIELRTISELRFAKSFSPEAFDNYVSERRDGTLKIDRLPAENDSILMRVRKIRERDYLYVDTMQDYYDGFSQQMHFAYQDFRRASYDSVVRARQLDRQGNRRIIAGIGAILAGIYGRSQANTRVTSDASTATAAVGGFVLKSGLEKKQEAAAYNESIAEMGSSLEAEIAPQVIELEDRTVTLTGTVQAQYQQWQDLLHKIYKQERGTL
ncbi:hypothetical protein N8137_03685 [Porticoccaceae bacterium]|jgi:hypothetical protein|nr:hypothetical protein [Porticoccaceae bacterium]MDC0133815.1 hypothetical protein [Porticoccaceae bacterium]MDC1477205.1 hypothetical protein [Porticoccaceae bacterium]|tara:strand:+ start:10747 stop:11976 length:1230 start_codon:yes stop_codon:yes gene_type:complete